MHPSQKFWLFEFAESFLWSFFSVLIYDGRHTYTRVEIYGRLNLPRAYVFNIEHLDILWAWIGHPSEKLWPFELLESLRCSFFSVSIYHGPYTYTRVKSYGRLNLPRPYMFNFESLDILWAKIEHPSEKFRPFEFLERFHCWFSSVSIYHRPHTYTKVKSYGHLNLPRASMLNFEHLDIS